MSHSHKEKRTKEEVVRLLERAIGQEEALLEKIKALEADLADCRHKATNPRHEVDALAIPASKVSFRLDYYRTEDNGPLKCIVEHLPSRESQTFDGEDFGQITAFVAQFVRVAPSQRPKKAPTAPPEPVESPPPAAAATRSPLLKKLLPELFGAPPPMPEKPVEKPAETAAAKPLSAPFLVLTDDEGGNKRAINKGQAIQILLPMQDLPVFQGKPCRLNLTAVSLEKKPHPTLNTFAHCLPGQENLQVPIQGLPLELGVYRLMLSMTLRDAPKLARYEDSRLLIVQ